jgi:hypothetical protein
LFSVSQPAACQAINEVAEIIASFVPEYIQFPGKEEQDLITEAFYQESGIPGVVGIVDGTHIRIRKPE